MDFIQQVEADNRERIRKYWQNQSKQLSNQATSHDQFISIINVNDFGIQNYAQSSDSIKVYPPHHLNHAEQLKANLQANLQESQVLERVKINCSGEIASLKQIYRQAESQYVCSIQQFIEKGKQIKTTEQSKENSQWKIERPSHDISQRCISNRASVGKGKRQNTSTNSQNIPLERKDQRIKKWMDSNIKFQISQIKDGKLILFQSPVQKFSQSKDTSTQGNLLRHTIMRQLAQPIQLIGESRRRKSRIQKDIVPIWKLVNDKKSVGGLDLGRKQYKSQEVREREQERSRRGKRKLNLTKRNEWSQQKTIKKQGQIDSLIKSYQLLVNNHEKQIAVEKKEIKTHDYRCDVVAFFPCFEFLQKKILLRPNNKEPVKDSARRGLIIHELQPLNQKEKTSQNSVISSKLSSMQFFNEKERWKKSRKRQIENNNQAEFLRWKSKSVGCQKMNQPNL